MLGMESMVIDSTVFVGYFRNNQKAINYLVNLREEIVTSRVVVMEIVAGLRSKSKITIMTGQLENLNVRILEIDEAISKLAGEIFEKYHATDGIGTMDAFVAATAMKYGNKLVTHNLKHFKMIKGLKLVAPY